MVATTNKSLAITNRDASPRVLNNGRIDRGMLYSARGLCPVTTGDSIGSKYLFGQIPSNACMEGLTITCPDIGTTMTADVGLYRTTTDGGVVVDQDFFASAVILNAGALNEVNILYEAGAAGGDPTKAEQPIWQILALASDPNITYDIVATATAASDATASILLKWRWTE